MHRIIRVVEVKIFFPVQVYVDGGTMFAKVLAAFATPDTVDSFLASPSLQALTA